MSAQTIDLTYAITGQSLKFDCPEGRPSSIVTSELFEAASGDNVTAETALSGSAAVETNPNTTFDADSGFGQTDARICNLAATTGVVSGQSYLATNALGEREFVEAYGISSGAYVVAREPLANAYASGDSFVSTRITHALDATWIADTANLSSAFAINARYRWHLVYVVGGVTHVHGIGVDLLRYPSRHDVQPMDVDRRMPGWIDSLPTQYREDQGRSLIDEAYRSIKFDLINLSMADQSVRNREVIDELVVLKAIEATEPNEFNSKRYADRLTQLIAFGKTDVAIDETGASAPADIRPFWRR